MSPLHPFTTTSSKATSKPLNKLFLALVALAAATLLATGCSSAVDSGASGGVTGPAFVVGTDAPLPSVTSFAVQLISVDAVTAGGTSVPLISGSPTVDFARFNGLQTLLDMNDVTAGTYTSINVTLGPATIGYLNTPSGAAPTVATEAATYTTTSQTPTITIALASPLIVTQGEPVGLHFDFDLSKSIQVSNGAITGMVTPTFDLAAVNIGDAGGYIDQFDAAVVSVDVATQSFVVEGPHGRQFTINVNGSTEWDNNESISSLTTSSVVRVSGKLDKADSTIDADEVAILTQNSFYADGQVTYVTPSTGAATSFDLYVRALLPTNTGLTLGQIAQVNLTGSEKFFIYQMHNPLTQFLFNSSGLLPGQDVVVGGPASGAASASAVTVNRISLHHWGYNGTVVPGSINTGAGTFQLQVTGFAGVLVPETVTVYTSTVTNFRGGLTSNSSLSNNENVRVVGVLLKNPFVSGQAILLAHYVDELP
jgi:hypothetical protein